MKGKDKFIIRVGHFKNPNPIIEHQPSIILYKYIQMSPMFLSWNKLTKLKRIQVTQIMVFEKIILLNKFMNWPRKSLSEFTLNIIEQCDSYCVTLRMPPLQDIHFPRWFSGCLLVNISPPLSRNCSQAKGNALLELCSISRKVVSHGQWLLSGVIQNPG